MTEQAGTTAAPAAPVFSNPFVGMAYAEIVELTEAYNTAAATLSKSRLTNAVVVETLANSDDPKIVEYRTKIDKVRATLKALESEARNFAKVNVLGATEVDEETEKATRETLKATKSAIDDLVKIGTRKGGDEFVNALPALNSVSGKGSGAHSGRGAGVARMRLATVQVNGEDFATFTKARPAILAAAGAEYTTKEIHTAYLDAAGVANFHDAPDAVSFDFTPTNGNTVQITILKDDVK